MSWSDSSMQLPYIPSFSLRSLIISSTSSVFSYISKGKRDILGSSLKAIMLLIIFAKESLQILEQNIPKRLPYRVSMKFGVNVCMDCLQNQQISLVFCSFICLSAIVL
ncbi:ORF-25 [Teiidae poxvirus 1]|nr:ORF-25 [Teiidae poxvirus 1]